MKKMAARFVRLCVLGLFLSALSQGAGVHYEKGVTEFGRGYAAWDKDAFETSIRDLRSSCEENPDSALTHYALGVACFHLMVYFENGEKRLERAAAQYMDEAEKALTRVLALDAKQAESHALLATLYGMRIQKNWLHAVRYGPLIQKHYDLAMLYGSESPRVCYLSGAGYYHMAKGKNDYLKAVSFLKKAQTKYEGEKSGEGGDGLPVWGYSSCFYFLGKSYIKLNDDAAARVSFEMALKLQPSHFLAKQAIQELDMKKR
jgi:tetratricopeptide (TPR) repeat protein